MKVSITLEFDTPAHAIVALDHINALRKGNFGETKAIPTGASGGDGSAVTAPTESAPAVTKPRKPRKSKATPPADPQAAKLTAPAAEVPSLADVQAAVKGIFETKGAVAALDLLKSMGAERAAELPEDKRAAFIEAAAAL